MALYPYQERVKALIQGGKSVVLQAPTGAGKTRAALTAIARHHAPFAGNAAPHTLEEQANVQIQSTLE